jgi:hypothetical protein
LEPPPPGAGFNTDTCTVPVAAISVARIDAVNCVELANVVVRSEPPQRTTELVIKLDPFTVNVKAAVPIVAVEGDIELTLGTGLFGTVVPETGLDCTEQLPAASQAETVY